MNTKLFIGILLLLISILISIYSSIILLSLFTSKNSNISRYIIVSLVLLISKSILIYL